jgi:predicted alpha-1,2-mannosidase
MCPVHSAYPTGDLLISRRVGFAQTPTLESNSMRLVFSVRALSCLALAGILLGAGLLSTQAAVPSPVDCVNPFVGTDAHGHTYPGAQVPFGMVQLSPDTPLQGWDGSSGYHYTDHIIEGFSHTHLSGTGVGGLGDILLMPTIGSVHLDAGTPGDGYESTFSHTQEHASPGYYRVFLETPGVLAELTATARCGFHRYTFPASDHAHIILDLAHGVGDSPLDTSVHVDNDTTLSGTRITNGWGGRRAVYFVMQFSRPFDSIGIAQNGQVLPAGTNEAQGREVKAFVNYQTKANEAILVKVGLSGTGIEGARKNLAAEIPGWDFDAVHTAARRQWSQTLNAVQIETPNPHTRATFYTNLYQSDLAPTLYNDVNGTYRGLDHQNHVGDFQNYTTFSLWDIYRAETPLLMLLQPARIGDMTQSLLTEYQQNGYHTTPIWPLWDNETWCMIGYHSAAVMADAYLKGFKGFNAEAVYQAIRDTAMQDRDGLASYKTLGYVASTPGGTATSRTLEYAYDDWCIARMAQALGHTADAQMFYQRAANYRNLFDRSTQFMRGRRSDGAWRRPFVDNGLVNDEYTEADAWQYAFAVQQDVPGLIKLYGGDAGFIRKMDALFTANSTIHTDIPDISGLIGQYSQGDEQCHHVAYLYDYAGAPWKTQQRIRQVMAAFYNDTPSGQCGNDDCGQMSAWYVFSALGFYPVNPADGVYAIGSPLVSKASIHLSQAHYGGHVFTVIAAKNSAKNLYIQSATLNGTPVRGPWITQAEIAHGGTLRLQMGPRPNLTWGHAISDRPPTEMPDDVNYAALPPPSQINLAQLTVPIRINCGGDSSGDFSPDLDTVEGAFNGSTDPIDTNVPQAAPVDVYQSEHYGSNFAYVLPVQAGHTYTVRLHFAEIFDNQAGERLENISINGVPELTNFDIFATAGEIDKAVVKDFYNIQPNAQGKIVISVSAAPSSPDQNAKISGIEVLAGS